MAERKIPIHLRGLEFKVQASWAAGDPGGAFTELRALDVKFTPGLTMHKPGYQKPEAARGPDAAIPGAKGGTLTFKTPLRGGAGATSAFATLAQYCGATITKRADDAASVDSATSSTIIIDNATHATTVGDLIMVSGSGTDTQIRAVTRKQEGVPASQTTLDIEPDWADTPANGDSLYAMDTIYPTIGEPSSYLCFYGFSGQGSTDRHKWTLTGCAGKWKLATTGADAVPVIEWEFMIDAWASSEASTTQDADAYNPAHPMLNDPFYVNDSAVKIASFGFDPAMDIQPFTAQSGTHGREGWLALHDGEPALEYMPYWDVDWVSRFENATEFSVFVESIYDTDEGWAIWCPKVQVLTLEEDDVGNKHTGSKMTFEVNDPGKNADSTNLPLWAIGITGGGP